MLKRKEISMMISRIHKLLMIIGAVGLTTLFAFSNPTLAGVNKTGDAVKATVTVVEKMDLPNTGALADAMKEMRSIAKTYWQQQKYVLYPRASLAYDNLNKALKAHGKSVLKPNWL